MSNVTASITKKGKQEFLVITLPIDKGVSASGKSMVVASTRGNVQLPDCKVDGKAITVGVNAYYPK